MNNYSDAPEVLKKYLIYMDTVRGKSVNTVNEYYLDIRLFFRFLKKQRGLTGDCRNLDDISIADVNISLLRTVTLSDLYDYSFFLSHERKNPTTGKVGLGDAARCRKVSSIRSYFKYLTDKAGLLDSNPAAELEHPKLGKKLPRYLSQDQSEDLLDNVDCRDSERDYLIVTLFLNCGLRVSELVGIDLGDIQGHTLTVTGKGNKQRVVYLNQACADALNDYIIKRRRYATAGEKALFLSERKNRISVSTVKKLVKKHMENAGIDSGKYSAHKLRHTAATLMYRNGVDLLTLKEVLGHEQLNTTQIYTHLDPASLRDAAEANPLSNIKRTPRKKDKDQTED